MARYLVYGIMYYSNSSNRNNARTAMQGVVDSNVGVDAEVIGTFAAGINNGGGTNSVEISLSCVDEATANTFRSAFLGAWSGYTRSTSLHSWISIVREGG